MTDNWQEALVGELADSFRRDQALYSIKFCNIEYFLREAIRRTLEQAAERQLAMYAEITQFAMRWNQVVGPDNSYYVTLEQLEAALRQLMEPPK